MRVFPLLLTLGWLLSHRADAFFRDFLQCHLCESVRMGKETIADCACDFDSVNQAVTHYYAPLLEKITTSTFFKYFRVDLERPCPFWHEEGQCMMEGCSVCTCDEKEVPQNWLTDYNKPATRLAQEHQQRDDEQQTQHLLHQQQQEQQQQQQQSEGWVSSHSSPFGYSGSGHDDSLGRLAAAEGGSGTESAHQAALRQQYLRDTEDDDDDWTFLDEEDSDLESEAAVSASTPANYGFWASEAPPLEPSKKPPPRKNAGLFVNLLENQEGFTGYSGASAHRVWRAIQEENCFSSSGAGGSVELEQCLEKRTFHRLMSGLQASISTHIARRYPHPTSRGEWGTNLPLFVRAVGSHRDRLVNLYFAFLFVLRAVVKAQPLLSAYSFETGNATEDALVKGLVLRLTSSTISLPSAGASAAALLGEEEECGEGEERGRPAPSLAPSPASASPPSPSPSPSPSGEAAAVSHVERCRHGFDERRLFHAIDSPPASAPAPASGPGGGGDLAEHGSASAKAKLRREFQMRFRNITRIMDCVSCEKCRVWGKLQILGIGTAIKVLLTPSAVLEGWGGAGSLSRQEIVALINTLRQLAASVDFAAAAAERELEEKMGRVRESVLLAGASAGPSLLLLLLLLLLGWLGCGRKQRDGECGAVMAKDKAERKRDWVVG